MIKFGLNKQMLRTQVLRRQSTVVHLTFRGLGKAEGLSAEEADEHWLKINELKETIVRIPEE